MNSAENNLLLATARYPMKSVAEDDFSGLLGEVSDWGYLLQTAGKHGLSPLLFKIVSDTGLGKQIPPEYHDGLRQSYFRSLMRNQSLLNELSPVLRACEEQSLPVMLLKGAALCQTVYDDVALRPFGDVDILVHEGDMDAAGKALESQGFKIILGIYRVSDDHNAQFGWHWAYHKKEHVIELHWDLTERSGPFHLDMDEYWQGAQPVKVDGNSAVVMNDENQLIHLCLHQFKHQWQHIRDLTDVALIAEKIEASGKWRSVLEKARAQRLDRCVYFNLVLARKVLGLRIDEQALAEFINKPRPGRISAAMIDLIAANMFSEHLPRRFWQLPMVHGFKIKADVVKRVFTEPIERDLQEGELAKPVKTGVGKKIRSAFRSIYYYRGLITGFFRHLLRRSP